MNHDQEIDKLMGYFKEIWRDVQSIRSILHSGSAVQAYERTQGLLDRCKHFATSLAELKTECGMIEDGGSNELVETTQQNKPGNML